MLSRLAVLAALAGIIALTATFVGSALPQPARMIDGAVVARQLHRETDLQMTALPGVPTAVGMKDVVSSHTSEDPSQQLLVTTFDSPAAAVQLTGTRGPTGRMAPQIFTRANVVLLYGHSPSAPDLAPMIRAILEGVPRTLVLDQPY